MVSYYGEVNGSKWNKERFQNYIKCPSSPSIYLDLEKKVYFENDIGIKLELLFEPYPKKNFRVSLAYLKSRTEKFSILCYEGN